MKFLLILTALILLLTWCNIPREPKEIEQIEIGGMELVYEYKYPPFPKGRE